MMMFHDVSPPFHTFSESFYALLPSLSHIHHLPEAAASVRYRFPMLNISQFYPRPNTPAARLKRLPGHAPGRFQCPFAALRW